MLQARLQASVPVSRWLGFASRLQRASCGSSGLCVMSRLAQRGAFSVVAAGLLTASLRSSKRTWLGTFLHNYTEAAAYWALCLLFLQMI
jgi:hypothetical protein